MVVFSFRCLAAFGRVLFRPEKIYKENGDLNSGKGFAKGGEPFPQHLIFYGVERG
jgi:hypothetical protein